MIGLPLRHWEFHPGCIGYSRCSLETWRNPQEIDVKNCAWCATSNSEAKSWRRSALLSRPTASNTWHMMHMLLKIQNAEWQRHPPQEHLNSFPEVEWSWTLQQSSMNSMKEKKTKRNNNQTSLMTPTCGFQNWRNKWPPSFTLPSLLFLSTRLPLPAKWPPCDQALIFPVALPEVSHLILACRQRQFSQVVSLLAIWFSKFGLETKQRGFWSCTDGSRESLCIHILNRKICRSLAKTTFIESPEHIHTHLTSTACTRSWWNWGYGSTCRTYNSSTVCSGTIALSQWVKVNIKRPSLQANQFHQSSWLHLK